MPTVFTGTVRRGLRCWCSCHDTDTARLTTLYTRYFVQPGPIQFYPYPVYTPTLLGSTYMSPVSTYLILSTQAARQRRARRFKVYTRQAQRAQLQFGDGVSNLHLGLEVDDHILGAWSLRWILMGQADRKTYQENGRRGRESNSSETAIQMERRWLCSKARGGRG